ncbi:MAG: hypothetical protein ACFFB0_08600 [Promethearchaeota archaeon]
MASYKTQEFEARLFGFETLKCDLCDSEDIVEDRGSYVCRNCGIVLEIKKLQYNRPYNDDIIQISPRIGATQVGTLHERLNFPNSTKFRRLNKRNLEQDNSRVVKRNIWKKISDLFTKLNLNDSGASLKQYIFNKCVKVYNSFRPGTKYRSVEKLVPVVTYYCLKLRNISRAETDFINNSEISKKEFNHFKLQMRNFLPKYNEYNRQMVILQKISYIQAEFNLDRSFGLFTRKILYKLWDIIKNTKDDVVAGLCASISALCCYKDTLNVNSICKLLNIRMSTIQVQVKSNFFERFNVKRFKSLVKSSDLLVDIMKRLGIFESPEETSDIVKIIPGHAKKVFNNNDSIDFYLFALKDEDNNLILAKLNIYKPYQKFNQCEKDDIVKLPQFNMLFRTYSKGKGPPFKC